MTNFQRASFKPQTNESSADYQTITVHFNPASLQFDVQNTLDQGNGDTTKQFVSQSTAKLTMELIFDTTQTGSDVRLETMKVANYLKPGSNKIPPIVLFEWGTFKFQGMFDAFKEKIDFFSAEGVPLRSTVSIAMSAQDEVFSPQGSGVEGNNNSNVELASSGSGSNPLSAFDVATQGGDARASRTIGAANGQESLRFGTGAALSAGGGGKLKGPAAFASAGVGTGLNLSVAGGVGVSLGLSASAVGSVEAGLNDGGAALAQFNDLHTAGTELANSFKPENLLPNNPIASLSANAGASFALGGQVSTQGGAGLSADVSAESCLTNALKFDD